FRSVFGHGVQLLGHVGKVAGELLCAGPVRGFLDHGGEDGLEEAMVFGEGELIVRGEGGFDGALRGGSDEFETSDEDAGGSCWRRGNAEWKNGIDEAAGNDVDEAGAFFEPGGFPGFEHGVGFVGEEALGNKDPLEIGYKRID